MDRDDSDDGSPRVEFSFHLPQCPAGRGSSGHAIPVVYLCVWLLQRDGVLLRVPPGAAVVISVRTFGRVTTWCVIVGVVSALSESNFQSPCRVRRRDASGSQLFAFVHDG